MQQWIGLRTLSIHLPEAEATGETPTLPASIKLIDTVALISQCPGLRAIVQGDITALSQSTQTALAGYTWMVEHSQQLAAFSSTRQRWHGLAFTEKTPIITAWNKLLGMVGLTLVEQGRVSRAGERVYGLQTVADTEQAIERAIEQGHHVARQQRAHYRQQHQAEVIAAAQQQMLAQVAQVAPLWEKFSAQLQAVIEGALAQRSDPGLQGNSSTSEVSDQGFSELVQQVRSMIDAAKQEGAAAVHSVRQMVKAYNPALWRQAVATG